MLSLAVPSWLLPEAWVVVSMLVSASLLPLVGIGAYLVCLRTSWLAWLFKPSLLLAGSSVGRPRR